MQLPLNVSPVSASFFGLMRQGIHLVLCVACSLLVGMEIASHPYTLCFALLCFNSRLVYDKIEEK
jgi:hypothetical protein